MTGCPTGEDTPLPVKNNFLPVKLSVQNSIKTLFLVNAGFFSYRGVYIKVL